MTMTANGFARAGRSGRTPHFLTVGLLVVICILAFNYWNVSSQNKLLQRERAEMTRNLEELALRRVHLEKRSELLDSQLKENNKNMQDITNDKNSCQMSLRDVGEDRDQLKERLIQDEAELAQLRSIAEDNNITLASQRAQLGELEHQVAKIEQELAWKEKTVIDNENKLKQLGDNLIYVNDEISSCKLQLQDLLKQQAAPPPQLPVQRHLDTQGAAQYQRNNLPVNFVPPQFNPQENGIPPGQIYGQGIAPEQGQRHVPDVPNVPDVFQKQDGIHKQIVPQWNAARMPVDLYKAQPVDNLDKKLEVPDVAINVNAINADDNRLNDEQPSEEESPDDFEDQNKFNQDPGMVNQLDDNMEKEGEDVNLLKDAELQDDIQQDNQDDAQEDGFSQVESESDDDNNDPDGGMEDGQMSPGNEDNQGNDNEEENVDLQIAPAELEDDKLRFQAGNFENQLNPDPNY